MVRKIKKRIKRTAMPPAPWVVAFDKDNQAAVYIHKHGDGDDHSQCGPVVTCCERASENYRRLAPELHSTVDRLETQSGQHLSSWLDNGVALCISPRDPDFDQAIYNLVYRPNGTQMAVIRTTVHLFLMSITVVIIRRPDYERFVAINSRKENA